MSRGKNLQEMETGTKQSKTAVNANAKAAEPMQKLTTGIPDGQTGSWEDLGGPTPENYKPDDDSAKLDTTKAVDNSAASKNAASIKMKASAASAKMEAPSINVEGSAMNTIKGGLVNVEASGIAIVKGSLVKIN